MRIVSTHLCATISFSHCAVVIGSEAWDTALVCPPKNSPLAMATRSRVCPIVTSVPRKKSERNGRRGSKFCCRIQSSIAELDAGRW